MAKTSTQVPISISISRSQLSGSLLRFSIDQNVSFATQTNIHSSINILIDFLHKCVDNQKGVANAFDMAKNVYKISIVKSMVQ